MEDTKRDTIYGDHLNDLIAIKDRLLGDVDRVRKELRSSTGMDPVEHCLGRIKSDESMREKCDRKGLPQNEESAIKVIRDAIGIRVVCSFLDDVYAIRDALDELPGCRIIEEKDYIRHAKPNGYRSLHLILEIEPEYYLDAGPDAGETHSGSSETAADEPAPSGEGQKYYAEIQLRTISMDTWGALEHHLKYKKDLNGNVDLITRELKRCADELAATDASMQTLRDMIMG